MGKTSVTGGLPPRFGVQNEQSESGRRRILWFGSVRIPLGEIEKIQAEEIRERPTAGLLLGACVFMTVAMMFAFGVFELGWRQRFLIGFLFLAGLGCAGLWETTKIKSERYFEVHIRSRTGKTWTFASANPSEVEALLGTLAAEGVKA